jgi:two-component system sensor histidine kinase BaeS
VTRLRATFIGLGGQLLLAHLLVIVVGLGTLFLAAGFLGPNFFERHMAAMAELHSGTGPGMGPAMAPGWFQGMPSGMAGQLDSAFRGALIEALAVAGTAALAAAVAVSLLVSRQAAKPIWRLAAASRRIAAGHYSERVASGGPHELRELGTSFNEMAGALEGAERQRVELIGDVAHELRTPIATIEGTLEGLLDGVVSPSERTWAKLHGEAARLRRLAEDLQQLSRAEAHQLALTLQPVAPTTIVQAAVDRLAPDFEAKGLELHVDVAPGLPVVYADPDRAIQVLTNLLTNAFRYTPAPGRVEMSVIQTGDRIRFQVRDTGKGISAEHLPHLFERFYRVDRSRSRETGGTGVGLTIARALVEAMGGRIWAESAGSGRGAQFSFELPLAPGRRYSGGM